MQKTTNLQLNKPDLTDYVNVGDLNDNADIIDAAITQNKDNATAHLADLASQEVGKGADIIGLPDPNSLFTATNIGGAMQELFTNVDDGKAEVSGAVLDVDPTVVIPTDPTFLQLGDAIRQISIGFDLIAGDNVIIYRKESDLKRTNSTGYVTVRSITFSKSGSIRVAYNYRVSSSTGGNGLFMVMIYDSENIGRQVDMAYNSGTSFRERVIDVDINEGERLELRISRNESSGYAENDFFSISIHSDELPFTDNLGGV